MTAFVQQHNPSNFLHHLVAVEPVVYSAVILISIVVITALCRQTTRETVSSASRCRTVTLFKSSVHVFATGICIPHVFATVICSCLCNSHLLISLQQSSVHVFATVVCACICNSHLCMSLQQSSVGLSFPTRVTIHKPAYSLTFYKYSLFKDLSIYDHVYSYTVNISRNNSKPCKSSNFL